MVEWWAPEVATRFEEATECVVAMFGVLQVLFQTHVYMRTDLYLVLMDALRCKARTTQTWTLGAGYRYLVVQRDALAPAAEIIGSDE